jgi:nicotinate phosphoribosyltransferase
VRRILDEGGLSGCKIFASGGLDEWALGELVASGAPIDGFGVGSHLDTSSDAPFLDCAYKLQEYAGRPRRKKSEGKKTWPGRKQVYRTFGPDGAMAGDTVTLLGDEQAGETLLRPMMRGGRIVREVETLAVVRRRFRAQLGALPAYLRTVAIDRAYPVRIARALRELADEMDTRNGGTSGCFTGEE